MFQIVARRRSLDDLPPRPALASEAVLIVSSVAAGVVAPFLVACVRGERGSLETCGVWEDISGHTGVYLITKDFKSFVLFFQSYLGRRTGMLCIFGMGTNRQSDYTYTI